MENNITIKDYFCLTIITTKYYMLISGIIYTVVMAVIVTALGFSSNSFIEVFKTFGICFLLGNAFALLIFIPVFMAGFCQTKSTRDLYYSIPENVREELGVEIIWKKDDIRYHFLETTIIAAKTEIPVFLEYLKGQKSVVITIVNDFKNIDFQKGKKEIDKKYRKHCIVLTGWGLRKSIKWKKWKKEPQTDIRDIIDELKFISEKEDMKIITRGS